MNDIPEAQPQGTGPVKAEDRGPDLTLATLKGLCYEVIGETIAISSDQCTCSPQEFGHEQYCGLDPVVINLSDRPERMQEVVGELNWLLTQLKKALETQEPPAVDVHYLPPMGGASHALPDVFAGTYTDEFRKVTCLVCLHHIIEHPAKPEEPKRRKGTSTVIQYGLKYGDGEIDHPYVSAKAVQVEIDMLRYTIEHNLLDPTDYEPMTIVKRTKTVHRTKWEEVTE